MTPNHLKKTTTTTTRLLTILFLLYHSISCITAEEYTYNKIITNDIFSEKEAIQYYEILTKYNGPLIYHSSSFPHIYIDGLFDDNILQQVVDEYPTLNDIIKQSRKGSNWYISRVNAQNMKAQHKNYYNLGSATKYIIAKLQSVGFLEFLSQLTGIDGLLPDPYVLGAGPHLTFPGGHLSLHLDYNYNDMIKMWRGVNVFLYLNEDWDDEWGGHLELWNENMTEVVTRIAPLFNRLVIFTPSETSWHGHPDPLKCPEHYSRKSIALYYYTVEDYEVREPRVTDFRPRPNIDSFTVESHLDVVD